MFSAMVFRDGRLNLIDQRQLPTQEVWLSCDTLEKVALAIEDMVVRGAPAIGCAAAWGLVVDAASNQSSSENWTQYRPRFEENVARLRRTRPTAVNLFYALDAMVQGSKDLTPNASMETVLKTLFSRAKYLEEDDIRTCKAIGSFGATLANKPIRVLTHCNTGSLATAGYGTALGVIRALHENKLLEQVWVDETRPYLQGARLTAFELDQEKIPYRLISDNMAAYLMQLGKVDLVIVGADRIAANGDTANKIGTYNLAVLCAYHKIPFVVAAPQATIDSKIKDGSMIPVEERPAKELLQIQGVFVAPQNAKVWNPSFDVTPHTLIHSIVTENGVHLGPNFKF